MSDESASQPPSAPPLFTSGAPTRAQLTRFAAVAWIGAVFEVCVGGAALHLWATGGPVQHAAGNAWRYMMPWTAVGHLTAGVLLALLLIVEGPRQDFPGPQESDRRVALIVARRTGALLLSALGVLALVQWATGIDVGMDRLLFPRTLAATGLAMPGMPSIGSAVGFVLVGAAAFLLDARSENRLRVGQGFALAVVAVGLLAVLGHAFGAPSFYEWRLRRITLPAGLGFLAFGAAGLCARPARGLMRAMTANDLGGVLARRLLLMALATPLAIGILRMLAARGGMVELIDGMVIVTVAAMGVLALAGWISSRRLRALESLWRGAQEELYRSEARLRATLEAMPVGVWFTDERGRIVYGNPAGQRIWGGARYVGPDEYGEYKAWWADTGKPIQPHEWGAARALKREASIDEEILIESFDGRKKLIRQSSVPLVDPNGKLQGVVVVHEDITARKQAEHEQERQQQRAEQLAREEAALGRAAAAVATAFTAAEIIKTIAESAIEAIPAQMALVSRIDPDSDESVVVGSAGTTGDPSGRRVPYPDSVTHRVVEAGAPLRVADVSRERIVPPHLRDRYAGSFALGVPLTDGEKPIGALFALRPPGAPDFSDEDERRATTFAQLASVTLRKAQLLEDSERKRTELQRVLAGQAWLVRGFSHDLKNPLGAADMRLAMLEEGFMDEMSPPQAEAVRHSRRSIGAALKLIDALVEFARAESGRVRVRLIEFDLHGLVMDMVEEHRPGAAAKGLSIHVEPSGGAYSLSSDPDRVRQILGNLLSNAVKYTTAGSVSVCLKTGRTDVPHDLAAHDGRGAAWATISVTDTGPGIPKERLGQLFGEFVRLDPSVAPGAGLGLSISRRLARLLGGGITITSDVGVGSTFELWLPMRVEAPAAAQTPVPGAQPKRRRASRAGEKAGGRPTK